MAKAIAAGDCNGPDQAGSRVQGGGTRSASRRQPSPSGQRRRRPREGIATPGGARRGGHGRSPLCKGRLSSTRETAGGRSRSVRFADEKVPGLSAREGGEGAL